MSTWFGRALRAFTPPREAPCAPAKPSPAMRPSRLMDPAEVIALNDDEAAGWWSSSLELARGVEVIESADETLPARDPS